MSRNVSINEMGNAIMEELEKYSKLATDDLKAAVKETAASVRKDIQAGAPVDTGKYKKSWSVRILSIRSDPFPHRAAKDAGRNGGSVLSGRISPKKERISEHAIIEVSNGTQDNSFSDWEQGGRDEEERQPQGHQAGNVPAGSGPLERVMPSGCFPR